jgi:hypothetical protein
MSDQFCQAVCPILLGSPTDFEIGIFLSLHPILCNSCPIMSQRFQMKLSINIWQKTVENFKTKIYREFHLKSLTGQELHKIGWRDRKIPIAKIGLRAWQNQTDSKNQTDFGFLCKRGVNLVCFLIFLHLCMKFEFYLYRSMNAFCSKPMV